MGMGRVYEFVRPAKPLREKVADVVRRADEAVRRSVELQERLGPHGSVPAGGVGGKLANRPENLRVVLSGVGSKNPIGNPIRKLVRPLVDSLVRDTNGVGCCCDGASEKFERFELEHQPLNHSSADLATIVHDQSACSRTMVESTFTDRLALAMGIPVDPESHTEEHRARKKAFARELGVSYQAIQKYFDDKSGAMNAKNCLKAAGILKVDAQWLATGQGQMHSGAAWPFGDQITPAEFYSLKQADLQGMYDALHGALRRRQEEEKSNPGKISRGG